jgi:nucleoside-diphosphate-sugar epimerase
VPEVHRLRDEVQWRPRLSLREAISDTIAWWRDQLVISRRP